MHFLFDRLKFCSAFSSIVLLKFSVAGYSRLGGGMAGLSSSMYPASYPASDQAAGPYPAISMENSAFYPSLVSASVSVRIHDDPGLQSRQV